MKTTDPARYFRNLDTPAARLARWQAPTWHSRWSGPPAPRSIFPARLDAIQKHGDHAGKTLAEKRRYLIDHQAPELSSPEAESPYLWIDGLDRSPLVLNYWAGREFLNHRGWFTHDEDQQDTLEAYAVQLADFPGLIFEAIRCSMSGTVRVMLEDFHAIDYSEAKDDYDAADAVKEAARQAIRSADSTAEYEAEEERRYQAEEDRKRQAEEAREDLSRNRATVRALIRDLRQLCPTDLPSTYPAAASAVKRQLADLLRDRSDLFDQLKTLES